MLTKPTLNFVRSLHLMVRMPAWKDVEAQLRAELETTTAYMLVESDNSKVHALRGRALALSEFLKMCGETTKHLEALEKSGRP